MSEEVVQEDGLMGDKVQMGNDVDMVNESLISPMSSNIHQGRYSYQDLEVNQDADGALSLIYRRQSSAAAEVKSNVSEA